ncbi:cytochrome P450 [Xylariaceae sp. FL0594]|nr:cytochrome P450 [Xylariaceae sp. FL0594]
MSRLLDAPALAPLKAFAIDHPSIAYTVVSALILSLSLFFLYRAALPRPLAGIPYNELSARNVFGDVPAMLSHIANEDGTFISYLVNTLEKLNEPLVQVFIKPFGRPLLILSDYQEAHHMMVHRTKEFDRSTSSGDLVRGLGPDHHIHLKTTPAWKAQRRLVQDLMTQSFLHHVAGPALYDKVCSLLDLWQAKSDVANGRPWVAGEDIDNVSLDAVMAFAFGKRFGEAHSAIVPALRAIRKMSAAEVTALRGSGGTDDPIEFPNHEEDKDELLSATLELVATVQDVQGSPLPDLHWAYVNRKPRIRRATKIKETYIKAEIQDALSRLTDSEEGYVKSAVDHMVFRETKLAEKDGRTPDYFSRVMMDEIFGFVIAGNDTSSTAISWGLKYLAENQAAQKRLRAALEHAFGPAAREGRMPTIAELTGTQVAYLEAVIEETLRCGASVPVVDRQAVVDTQLLGHHIPKGTVVTCLVTGPSMTSPAFSVEASKRREDTGEKRLGAWDAADMGSFKPERWLRGGGEARDGHANDSLEFDAGAGPQLAFGLGTRQCFGKRLARLEMRIIMALIVWRFELLPCPAALSGHQPVLIMTNRPKHCYVRLREVHRMAFVDRV